MPPRIEALPGDGGGATRGAGHDADHVGEEPDAPRVRAPHDARGLIHNRDREEFHPNERDGKRLIYSLSSVSELQVVSRTVGSDAPASARQKRSVSMTGCPPG